MFVWLGPLLSVLIEEVSTYGRLKMRCLCVARTTAQCIRIEEVSTYERLKMGCLCVVRTTTECLYRKSVRLWKVKNAMFVCG